MRHGLMCLVAEAVDQQLQGDVFATSGRTFNQGCLTAAVFYGALVCLLTSAEILHQLPNQLCYRSHTGIKHGMATAGNRAKIVVYWRQRVVDSIQQRVIGGKVDGKPDFHGLMGIALVRV